MDVYYHEDYNTFGSYKILYLDNEKKYYWCQDKEQDKD